MHPKIYRLLSHVTCGAMSHKYREKYHRLKYCGKPKALDPNVLRIAILDGGGMGDATFQVTYIKEIRKLFDKPVIIDFYCNAYRAFQGFPFIDNCFPYNWVHDIDSYDVYIVGKRVCNVIKIDEEKVKKFSLKFYDFCMDCKNVQTVLDEYRNDRIFSEYALLFGKNRFEQTNIHNVLPIDRNTKTYFQLNEKDMDVLQAYNLVPGQYITMCRMVDARYDNMHPKMWPVKHYNELVRLLHRAYPDIKLVQIGSKDTFELIDGVDVNLVGMTSLGQSAVILKNSLLHIDGEGGLPHLQHMLNNRSLVMFGPTSPDVFGYPENINLRSTDCPYPCEWIVKNWASGCVRGFAVPPCMHGLKPKSVFDAVKKHIDSRVVHEYKFLHATPKFSNKSKVAILGRMKNTDVTAIVKSGANVIVYDNNLAINNPENQKNCDYLHYAHKHGFNAEYCNQYNIPAKNDAYDVLIYNMDINTQYADFAINEALRVIKPGGKLFIPVHPGKQIVYNGTVLRGTDKPVCVCKC